MRLVVDTSVLVGELLRVKGRGRLRDERFELFIPEEMGAEVSVELPRRVAAFARRRGLSDQTANRLVAAALGAIDANVLIVDEPVYAAFEEEARSRSARDESDWPLVACALALDAGVWTNNGDLLGTGVPTWTTSTLDGWLARNPDG